MCWSWWIHHLKKVLIWNTERNVPATYIEYSFISITGISQWKTLQFLQSPRSTGTYHGKVLYHWLFLPSSNPEANLSKPLPMFLADFVEGDVPLNGLKHVNSASLMTTTEDFWNQVKGSQNCQAIKKIRSHHKSVRTHFIQFHLLIAVLFPACAWRGREVDFNIVVKYLG